MCWVRGIRGGGELACTHQSENPRSPKPKSSPEKRDSTNNLAASLCRMNILHRTQDLVEEELAMMETAPTLTRDACRLFTLFLLASLSPVCCRICCCFVFWCCYLPGSSCVS